MHRLLTILVATAFLPAAPAIAQTDTQPDLASQSPQENARSGRVHQRAPGTWVRAAIRRHKEFIGQRVNAPRSGQNSSQNQNAATGSVGNSANTGSLDGLTGLASQLLGGLSSLGGIGSLSGLGNLGNLVNLTGGTTGSNYTIDDLLRLRDALAAQEASGKSSSTRQQSAASDQGSAQTTSSSRQFGGAIARLPKAADRFQSSSSTTSTTTERKFTERLLQSWATTFFSALTLGFQSSDFIKILKDGLRPLILPSAQQGTDTSSTGSGGSGSTGGGTGSGGSGTGGSGSGSTSGGGIQNLPPASSGAGGGSTI